MKAFVYCWTDRRENRLYVGIHKGTGDDGYISSSKVLNAQYKIRPTDFHREIISSLGSYEELLKLETAILESVNAKQNPDFYNMHNGDGKFYNKQHTLDAKKKISISKLGKLNPNSKVNKVISEETREKMRQAAYVRWTGFSQTEIEERNKKISSTRSCQKSSTETCEKISKALTGRKRTKAECDSISKGLKGRSLSEAHKKAISEGKKKTHK